MCVCISVCVCMYMSKFVRVCFDMCMMCPKIRVMFCAFELMKSFVEDGHKLRTFPSVQRGRDEGEEKEMNADKELAA